MRGGLLLALIVVVVLAATGVWNPFPSLWDWVDRSEPIAEPDVVWQQRIGGTPRSVTIAGDTVVVEQRTRVEARALSTGSQLWERKADWSAVAGGDRDAVVVVGKLLVKGYEVLDPTTGATRRRDDDAVAVWTYRNLLLDAHCVDATDCTLSAWDPRGSTPLWTAFMPGVRSGLLGDNPGLLGTRRLDAVRIDEEVAGPEPVPPLLGFPVDGRVHVVDTPPAGCCRTSNRAGTSGSPWSAAGCCGSPPGPRTAAATSPSPPGTRRPARRPGGAPGSTCAPPTAPAASSGRIRRGRGAC